MFINFRAILDYVMGLIERLFKRIEHCEEEIIEGRRIFICSKYPEYLQKYKKGIFRICASEEIAKIFPILWFSLEKPSGKDKAGRVELDELRKGLIKIHLVPDNTRQFGLKLKLIVVHELTHAWHDYLSKWARKTAKWYTALHQALSRQLDEKILKSTSLPDARKRLHAFVWLLQVEGIATYAGIEADGSIRFDEKYFLFLYEQSKVHSQKLSELFSRLPNRGHEKQSVIQGLRHGLESVHTLGLHLVFSLIYFDDSLTLEKIAKMKPFTFVKKYEACMAERGFQPVVSLTSGAGYFDYKWAVELWWKAVKG